MANRNDDYVDISSSADIQKAYGGERSSSSVKRLKHKGLGLRITCLVLSLILLVGGCGLVYYYKLIDKLNFKEVETQEVSTIKLDNGETIQEPLSDDSILNILLFGMDASGTDGGYGLSDTTILLSLDAKHEKIKLTSFQRDSYVQIPNYGARKINSAFSLGGEGLSIDTIQSNFAIKVDKYATVDFDSFREIIGILGGVDIELSLDEIKYINAQIDVNDQTDRTSFLTYDETKETQMMHLDGYQALWYARDRGSDSLGGNPDYSFNGDDWDRTSRQRNLLETIIKSLRENASFDELVAIANKIGPLVTTNLKKSDINFLVSNIMTYINYDMEELSVPTQDTWKYAKTEDDQSIIYIYDYNKLRMDIAKFIFEDGVSAQ